MIMHKENRLLRTINLAKVLTPLPSSCHAQNKPLFMQYVCTQLVETKHIVYVHSYSMQTQKSIATAQRNQILQFNMNNINNHQN